MIFNTSGLSENLANGLRILSSYFDFSVGDGIRVTAERGDSLITDFDGEELHVVYPEDVAFYRAVGNVCQTGTAIKLTEAPHFDMCGAMYDHSRDGVLNVKYTKRFISKLAMLGMNTYLMYMEDVYELESEPYFGYRRGRYTVSELREIDDFAYALGIEVIPCVQTLAHMNQFIRHYNIAEKYQDIDDILEVGKPEVCDLIERILCMLKSTFRSNRIHVGMDEAYNVGRGKYLDRNGYQSRKEVLTRHLDLLKALSDKYDLELMMWDDMFYNYADSDLHNARPERMRVVFWNYYAEDVEYYRDNLSRRMLDDPNVIFAGGAWRWGCDVPCHRKTETTTDCALTACIEMGVRNVFTALWGDDGSEAPAETGLFGAVMFAEYNYQSEYSRAAFANKLRFITGLTYDEWMLEDEINAFDKSAAKDNTFSKYAMYQDPLCGLFDEHTRLAGEQFDLTRHYKSLAEKFELLCDRGGAMLDINVFYAAVCRVLELKWNLGNRLTDAYRAQNKEELINIVDTAVIPLIERVELMREARLTVWNSENKTEGFEVIDQRMGTLRARLDTTARLIREYADGTLDSLDCLDSECLLQKGYGEFKAVDRHPLYTRIFSAGRVW